jgi:hypothetical protein
MLKKNLRTLKFSVLVYLIFVVYSAACWSQASVDLNLRGPSLIRPGLYRVTPQNSNLCLNIEAAAGPRIEHIALRRCDGSMNQTFLIVPRGLVDSYTIRAFDGVRCLTGARSVIIGAPSLDVTACDFSGGTCNVRSSDQTWGLRAPNNMLAAVGYGGEPYGAGGDQIWAVRDDSVRSVGIDLIIYNSTDVHAQNFQFQQIGSLPAQLQSCAIRAGYGLAPDGLRWSGHARGVGLESLRRPSFPEMTVPTLENCMQRCVADTRCTGWTYATNTSGCILFPGPTRTLVLENAYHGTATSQYTFSGIVRP